MGTFSLLTRVVRGEHRGSGVQEVTYGIVCGPEGPMHGGDGLPPYCLVRRDLVDVVGCPIGGASGRSHLATPVRKQASMPAVSVAAYRAPFRLSRAVPLITTRRRRRTVDRRVRRTSRVREG
jgi:hypothetical protein